MISTNPQKENRKASEIRNASFSRTVFSKQSRTAVTTIALLEKQTLNGSYTEIINPASTFTTNKQTEIIITILFMRYYFTGGTGGIGGGHRAASAGTDLIGAQLAIPVVHTKVSSLI